MAHEENLQVEKRADRKFYHSLCAFIRFFHLNARTLSFKASSTFNSLATISPQQPSL